MLLLPVCLEFYPRFLLRAGFYGGVSTYRTHFYQNSGFSLNSGFLNRPRAAAAAAGSSPLVAAILLAKLVMVALRLHTPTLYS